MGRLTALGATAADWVRCPDDPEFLVPADPGGNRCCVIDTRRG